MRIVTIGGYGFTEESFVRSLRRAGVDTFVDVRQRRGMRGSKYSFLNSKRLQALLALAAIRYVHATDLAPTSIVREAQSQADLASGTAKRDRARLSPTFVAKYASEILARVDPERMRDILRGAGVAALFCVEGNPMACHRSIAADAISKMIGSDVPVEHLTP